MIDPAGGRFFAVWWYRVVAIQDRARYGGSQGSILIGIIAMKGDVQ